MKVLTVAVGVALLFDAIQLFPQEAQDARVAAVPALVQFSGMLRSSSGQPLTGIQSVTFALYRDQEGGPPLWLETQNVISDENGRFSAVLGSASRGGVPLELFTEGHSRWVGVRSNASGLEQSRFLLLSVPYALKAADADTIGGKPASAFVLAADKESGSGADLSSRAALADGVDGGVVSNATGVGTNGRLAKWVDDAGTLGDSVAKDIGTAIEIDGPSSEVLRLKSPDNTYMSLNSTGVGRQNRALFLDQFGKFYVYNTTANVPEFVVDGSHNIGIGTSLPVAPFHIFRDGPNFVFVEGNSPGIDVGWGFKNNSSGKQWSIRTSGSGHMIFMDDTGNTQRLTIGPNGFVGIGNPNPTSSLDVNGTARATSFTGNGAGLTNLPAATDVACGAQCLSTSEIVDGAVTAAKLSLAARTRAITYLGGCDTCGALTDSDDQKTIYFNVVGPMTITSITCFSDAGSPTINLRRDRGGSLADVLSSPLTCSPNPTPVTSIATPGLDSSDKLDFVMATAGGVAKRVTVSIQATVN